LKDIYTSIEQKDIFSTNPFIITKSQGEFEMKINHFSILMMFLKGAKTFGESKNLRKLICDIVTQEDYKQMRQNASEL